MIYHVLVGIPENPHDNGLIGDIKDIKESIDELNGRVRGNEVRSKVNQAIIAIILGSSGITIGVTKILNVW